MAKNDTKNSNTDNKGIKKITKIIILIIVILASIGIISGLKRINENTNTQKVVNAELYFLEESTSLMKSEKREIKGDDIIIQVLNGLKQGPKTEGFVKVIPDSISFLSAELKNGIANVSVSPEYKDMGAGEELLCRASIVWTLTGLDFVDKVVIDVDGEELLKTNGEAIGAMGRDDVVIDAQISPETKTYETVSLYFANKDATGFGIESREIEVNPNQPIEKYVMEQLIAGPSADSGLAATVPSETKIRDIKTVDGVCYVDLSNEFVSKHSGGSTGEYLTIYSIVNSLCDLSGIKRVQFLIEGQKVESFKGDIDFSMPFEATNSEV